MISKFAPKRSKYLIQKSDIKEQLRRIDCTEDYWITPTGKIYREYPNGLMPRKAYTNARNGYIYVTLVNKSGKKQTYRLHKLVAIAYIPNPNNLPIVGHKDNVKTNCSATNLYWTTLSENSQKAVNDGLLVNAKGYKNSQSKPVICYDKNMKEIAKYGSVSECHRKIGVSKSTIIRHCEGEIKGKTRSGYYFRYQNA